MSEERFYAIRSKEDMTSALAVVRITKNSLEMFRYEKGKSLHLGELELKFTKMNDISNINPNYCFDLLEDEPIREKWEELYCRANLRSYC